MADKILMRCEYCGGTLINVGGNRWECQSCGTSTIVDMPSATSAAVPAAPRGFTMYVESGEGVSKYKVKGKAEFKIAFDRRATMADPFPIEVSLVVDDRPRGEFKKLPKAGTGTVVFEVDDDAVLAYATGKASFIKDGDVIADDDDADGSYTVAGLSVSIERAGEAE